MKEKIKIIQKRIGVTADGIMGPVTLDKLLQVLGAEVHAEVPVVKKAARVTTWPTQKEVRSGRSVFGRPGSGNLMMVEPPYPLYYEGQPVKRLGVHREVAAHVVAALSEVLEHYGPEGIERLGLDQYGGCYNYRATSGGSELSMHAWGVALDFCPAQNALRMKAPEASLSRPECAAWWDIWEKYGAVSLGRERGYDWMHVQFARLK